MASGGEEWLQQASALKASGNQAFAAQKFGEAAELYADAANLLLNHAGDSNVDCQRANMLVLCWSNRAQCFLKLKKYEEALADSAEALKLAPDNEKAAFRRAMALEKLCQYDEAVLQLQSVLQKYPHNTGARLALQRIARDVEKKASDFKSPLALARKIMQETKETKEDYTADVKMIICRYRESLSEQTAVVLSGFPRWLFDQGHSDRADASTYLALTAFVQATAVESAKSELWQSFLSTIIEELCHLLVNDDTWHEVNVGSSLSSLLAAIGSEPIYSESLEHIIHAVKACISEKHRHQTNVLSQVKSCLTIVSTVLSTTQSSLAQIRKELVESLLFVTPGMPELQQDVLRILVLISRSNSDSGTGQDTKKCIAVTDEEFSTQCEALVRPLLASKEKEQQCYALNALLLLLQADPQSSQTMITADSGKYLAMIVDMAVFGDQVQRELATEVLAMASSDAKVRGAIVEADMVDIFFDAVNSENPLVVSHACVALAKISASDEETRKKVLKSDLLKTSISILRKKYDEDAFAANAVYVALECILYLCIYYQVKRDLAEKEHGDWLKSILALADNPQRAVRYAVAQIMASLATSASDIKAERELDSDKEKLRKVASKGLPNADKEDATLEMAGSDAEIKVVRKLMAEHGVVRALSKLSVSSEGVQSDQQAGVVVTTILRMASDPENRGFLVQQGAFRLLLRLSESSQEERIAYDTALAIARICISTNPNLYSDAVAPSLPAPLLSLLQNASHELHEYECVLALTNLASLGHEMGERMLRLRAWQILLNTMCSQNETLQIACVEALANLTPCQTALNRLVSNPFRITNCMFVDIDLPRLRTDAGDTDIKIFLAFAKDTDNERAQVAALTGLAVMSFDSNVAMKIIRLGGQPIVAKLKDSNYKPVRDRAQACYEKLKDAEQSDNPTSKGSPQTASSKSSNVARE